MIETNTKLEGIRRTVAAKVTPNGDPEQSRIFRWTFDFSECTIEDVIELAIRPRRITTQNSIRYDKKFAELPEEETFYIKPLSVREVKILTADALWTQAAKLSDAEKQKLIDKVLSL